MAWGDKKGLFDGEAVLRGILKGNAMLVGYARVSTIEQSLDLQTDALNSVGCEKIFTDVGSGVKTERKGLNNALSHLRANDILVVWKLDRLGRSLLDLINTVKLLEKNNVGLKSLHEAIDTTTPSGQLFFHIFGALAEFERELIRERTKAGLTAARARGRLGGRPKKLSNQQREQMLEHYHGKQLSINEICRLYRISSKTLYRNLSKN